MKTSFFTLLSLILFSSAICLSCGNKDNNDEIAQKLLDHLIACSNSFEQCKENCPPRPTKEQMDLYWKIRDGFCDSFQFGDPDAPDDYECHLYAAQEVFGDQYYDMYCHDQCIEGYYECIFGDEWEDLNLKKPENFQYYSSDIPTE